MVDLDPKEEIHNEIKFENEKVELVSQKVKYTWLSIMCTKCHRIGHKVEQCSTAITMVVIPKKSRKEVDDEGFVRESIVANRPPLGLARSDTRAKQHTAHNNQYVQSQKTPSLNSQQHLNGPNDQRQLVATRNSFCILDDNRGNEGIIINKALGANPIGLNE